VKVESHFSAATCRSETAHGQRRGPHARGCNARAEGPGRPLRARCRLVIRSRGLSRRSVLPHRQACGIDKTGQPHPAGPGDGNGPRLRHGRRLLLQHARLVDEARGPVGPRRDAGAGLTVGPPPPPESPARAVPQALGGEATAQKRDGNRGRRQKVRSLLARQRPDASIEGRAHPC